MYACKYSKAMNIRMLVYMHVCAFCEYIQTLLKFKFTWEVMGGSYNLALPTECKPLNVNCRNVESMNLTVQIKVAHFSCCILTSL